MKLIKFTLALILVLTVGLVGFYVAGNRGWLPSPIQTALAAALTGVNAIENISNFSQNQLSQDASSQLKILSDRSQEVGFHSSKVLGSYVEASDNKPPLHERAIEYGRYLYCQQVVQEYEGKETNQN